MSDKQAAITTVRYQVKLFSPGFLVMCNGYYDVIVRIECRSVEFIYFFKSCNAYILVHIIVSLFYFFVMLTVNNMLTP